MSMKLLLLCGIAVATLLCTLALIRVRCLAVIGELLGVAAMLLLEPLGDPGFKLHRLGLAVVQKLRSLGNLDRHGLHTLELSSSFSLPKRYSHLS
jgi:hypothetical protein